ncbi:hypothetical protein [Paenibacillus humicus]|uniref:hypothetical protein n=1 Tax=Paenibacillus humicus TaxID=412861 RepID=UPI000FD7828C|nr:hypothetical protein [Paenibacillus humicus]
MDIRTETRRLVVIYEPVVIPVELSPGSTLVPQQDFTAGNGEIKWVYCEAIDNGLPADIHDLISSNEAWIRQWAPFKKRSKELALIIEEGLLQIGVRV